MGELKGLLAVAVFRLVAEDLAVEAVGARSRPRPVMVGVESLVVVIVVVVVSDHRLSRTIFRVVKIELERGSRGRWEEDREEDEEIVKAKGKYGG